MNIRIGNTFNIKFAITKAGEPYDLNDKDLILIMTNKVKRSEIVVEEYTIIGDNNNVLYWTFEGKDQIDRGQYILTLYENHGQLDMMTVDCCDAFNLVARSCEEDGQSTCGNVEVEVVEVTADFREKGEKGDKGDKGDPFTYDDFTAEQIEDLKRPAIEAAESVLIVENQISINEQGRVLAENLRVTAESSRESAESQRVEAELLRQSNTQEAISNAETATTNANNAASNADNARLAIQDDLALKADQADLVQLESDGSLLRDDATVKIENLIVNGNFRDGISGWGGSGTLVNGKLKLKTTTPDEGEFASNSYVSDWDIGNKIYSFVKVDVIDGYEVTGSKYIMLRVGSSASAGNFCFFSNGDVLPKGINTFSSITIADKAGQLFYGIYDRDSIAEVDFLNVINIDLTKTFGAGNEPTTDEMELLISTLGIEYFEGETTIPAQIIMQWQLKLKSNAISALTKSDVGLGNVDNTSDANKPVSTAQQTAINSGVAEAKTYADGKFALAIPLTQKGAASGVAELDSSGKVLSSQLPSYVDDVLNYTTQSNFPATGESGKIYVTEDTNKTYRWTGSAYVEISPSIALGETSSTAYRGDRGKIAYDHSQSAHAPTNAQKNSDITKSEIEAKLIGDITSHTHSAYVPTSRTVAGKALTGNITLAKGDVGLGNVDNTSDLLKPISTATQTALNQLLPKSGGTLENYVEKLTTTTGAINLNDGNVFHRDATANTTFSITNAKAGAHSFTLIITMGATVRTLTFPSSVKWQDGKVPEMTEANKTYILTFMTINSGTTWFGMEGGSF